jgi:hypothetical protein
VLVSIIAGWCPMAVQWGTDAAEGPGRGDSRNLVQNSKANLCSVMNDRNNVIISSETLSKIMAVPIFNSSTYLLCYVYHK